MDAPKTITLARDELGQDTHKNNSLMTTYVNRWKKHLASLFPNKEIKIRDSFDHGFLKYICFGNKNGKVVMLDTFGNTIWQRYFKDVEINGIYLLRESRQIFPPVISIVGFLGGKTIVYEIDATNGNEFGAKIVYEQRALLANVLDSNVYQIKELDLYDNQIKSLLLVFKDGVKLFPASNQKAISKIKDSVYFYLGGVGDEKLFGYHLVENGLLKISWTLDLPNGEVIVSISNETPSKVASMGRVLGDRSVLYKYLNPNLVAVVTKKTLDDKSTLFVYLLDTVSGKVHSRIAHYGVSKENDSVQVLKCENFVVYTFYNVGSSTFDKTLFPPLKEGENKRLMPVTNSKHHEMVVLELYESNIPDQRFEKYFLLT
jgi:hypothetical protein